MKRFKSTNNAFWGVVKLPPVEIRGPRSTGTGATQRTKSIGDTPRVNSVARVETSEPLARADSMEALIGGAQPSVDIKVSSKS